MTMGRPPFAAEHPRNLQKAAVEARKAALAAYRKEPTTPHLDTLIRAHADVSFWTEALARYRESARPPARDVDL